MTSGVLFRADPLRGGRPDPLFAEEAAAVRDAGAPVALVGHDAPAGGDMAMALARVPGFGAGSRAPGR